MKLTQQTTALDSFLQQLDSAKRNEYDSMIRANPALFDTSAAARDAGFTAWRARQEYRPYSSSSSGPSEDEWAALIGVVVVFALVVRQALRVRHARQAARASGIPQPRPIPPAERVRSWHAGQLATAWVGVLLADVALRWLFVYNVERGYDSNDFGAALCVLVGAGLTGAMLWASWTWFGNRERKT